LITKSNILIPDEVYELLILLHDGCTQEESNKRNAKLILMLANHIGDPEVIREAIAIASVDGALN